MKPTDEQIKKFWERFGFKYYNKSPVMDFPDGTRSNIYYQPPIDLNNLFKYAVPKLQERYTLQHIDYDLIRNQVLIWYWIRHTDEPDEFTAKYGIDKDLALALFWAIWGVIHNE